MFGQPIRALSRRLLLVAAAFVVAISVGCTDEEADQITQILSEPTQLELRQAALAEAAAGMYDVDNPPPTTDDDCTITLEAGSDPNGDAQMLNEAVEDADSWDVICLAPGTYKMGDAAGNANGTVFVSAAANLTVKGIGATPDDVLLDYAEQSDDRGFDVTTPGFWIENLAIKDTNANGIEVKADNDPENPNVFRKLHVYWTTPENPANGAYSVYPTKSQYVIVEFCEVSDASDAGLYIGQVEYGIVRFNEVHGNVAGLEVENSFSVDVYGNDVHDNTGGILALQEPGLQRLENEYVVIRDNVVVENNTTNFARPGTTVANIPPGTGMMSFAGTDIEFRDNVVEGNDSTGLLIVSNAILDALGGESAPWLYPDQYDPFPSWINQTGNTYVDNGLDPQGALALFLTAPVAPIVWDGLISNGVDTEHIIGIGAPPLFVPSTQPIPAVDDPNICFGSDFDPADVTILNDGDGPDTEDKHDVNDYFCDMRPVVPVEFP